MNGENVNAKSEAVAEIMVLVYDEVTEFGFLARSILEVVQITRDVVA